MDVVALPPISPQKGSPPSSPEGNAISPMTLQRVDQISLMTGRLAGSPSSLALTPSVLLISSPGRRARKRNDFSRQAFEIAKGRASQEATLVEAYRAKSPDRIRQHRTAQVVSKSLSPIQEPSLVAAAYAGRAGMVHNLLSIVPDRDICLRALRGAILMGRNEVVDVLLKHDNVVNEPIVGKTPLMHAAIADQVAAGLLLVARGADVDATNAKQQTALSLALKRSNFEFAAELIPVVNERTFWEVAPSLAFAIRTVPKPSSLRKALIQRVFGTSEGLNPESEACRWIAMTLREMSLQTAQRRQCFMNAICQGDARTVKLYLLAGNIDLAAHHHSAEIAEGRSMTPLALAAFVGNRVLMQLFLACQVNVNAVSPSGYTAAMEAARGGRLDALRLLVDHKADLALTDSRGWTALDFALAERHWPVATYLIERMPLSAMRSSLGLLWNCFQPQPSKAVASALIKRYFFSGPLELEQLTAMCEWIMVKSKAIPHTRDERVKAFVKAVKDGDSPLARLLFLTGDIDLNADYRWEVAGKTCNLTAACAAVAYEKLAMLKVFIKLGADVNKPSSSGVTPLTLAADSGQNNMVSLLLKHKPTTRL